MSFATVYLGTSVVLSR